MGMNSHWPMGKMLVLLGLVGLALFSKAAHVSAEDPSTVGAKALSRAFRLAAGRATPSVVTVINRVKAQRLPSSVEDLLRNQRINPLAPDDQIPFRLRNQQGRTETPTGEVNASVGSGVIIDSRGIILTNSHVIRNADRVIVRLADGTELTATTVREDRLSDLAVLKVAAPSPLDAAKLGNSDELETGDWVIAIGSPFELEATVSAGIISGKGRGISKIKRGSLLQTDAAINPGNSGGPLVNLDGEVIGINTAIASMSGGYQGIGFAIPINRAKWVSTELLAHNRVRRAYLGIRINEITPELAARLKIPVRAGVFVVDVMPNGAAAAAGIQSRDIIVDFAGQRVGRARDLQDIVEQKRLDSLHPVRILRQGKELQLEVRLTAMPAEK